MSDIKRSYLLRMSMIALFAALTAAGAFIIFPVPGSPVPVVLQNFFVFCAGLILGPLDGFLAVLIFLLAGALGAPVFSGARGGIAHIVGPTGGFLLGYLVCALVIGFLVGRPRTKKPLSLWWAIISCLIGALCIYIPGLIRLSFVMGGDWGKTLTAGLIPFIPGDLVKIAAASLIAPRLRKTLSLYIDA